MKIGTILALWCLTSGQPKFAYSLIPGDLGDEDTVVINAAADGEFDEIAETSAGGNRQKRQFSVFYPAVLPAEVPVKLEGSPCDSLKNERGNCTTISDCYPLLYASPGEENREPGLVDMFKANSGVCEDVAVGGFRTYGALFPAFRTVLRSQQELICCTSGQQRSRPIPNPFPQPPRAEKFVVGGSSVNDISKFPWLVSMHIRGRHSCGGSLITANTVLTAAHCLMGLTSRDVATMKIYFGHHDISQAAAFRGQLEVRTPAQVKYHRAFSMRGLNDDIGLIILNSPIPANHAKIKPVTLATLGGSDKEVTVAGWGQTSWTSSTSSRLLEATMDLWSHSKCQLKYSGFQVPVRISPDKQICAGSPGKDSCRGDSGSSLHVNRNGVYQQVGIVSFGGKCGEFPGVYTQPSAYSAWIEKNKKD